MRGPTALTESGVQQRAGQPSRGETESQAFLASTSDRAEKLIVIALFVCAIACYANTLNNSFVYDDDQQILQNPYVKSWQHIPQVFTSNVWSFIGAAGNTNYYRPLMTLTYLVLWKSFGGLPIGFHLFNVLLNALVVVAVYYVGRDLFRDRTIGATAAFLFAVHPVHTEAVSWIAALPDLEATLLVLIALHAYAKISSVLDRKQILVVAAYLLALLAKEPALALAPLLVVYEHIARDDRQQTSVGTKLARYAPVCLAGMAYLLCRTFLLGQLAPVLQHPQLTWPQTIYSAFALIAQYIKLLQWPSQLSAFHVFHPCNSLMETPVLAGIAIVAATILFIRIFYQKLPALVFSLVWVGLMLVPVLNARWMASNVFAERYLYLPSIGFCWIAGWVIRRAWETQESTAARRVSAQATLGAAVAGILLLGAIKTFSRNHDWRDNITLYSKTLQTDPDSYVMHLNLGSAYVENRNFAGAQKQLSLALALKPDSANVLNALGCLYLEQGRLPEAAKMIEDAIAQKPFWTDPHFNYGRVLRKAGKSVEARQEFLKAIELGPMNSRARFYLAQASDEDGAMAEAESAYRQSIELIPSPEAEQGLIDILLKSGRTREAEAALRESLRQYPFDGRGHLKLAKLLEAQGRTEEALQEYRAALDSDVLKPMAEESIKRLTLKN